MRDWFTVCLGTWHPYKQANILIWTHWGQRYFGPLYHDLIPSGLFFEKPKLIVIATFFTYVRLAYPYFKAELEAAMAETKKDEEFPDKYAALLDLHQLLEFFIPVVRVIVFCCLSG
jgi:hypothetical protein